MKYLLIIIASAMLAACASNPQTADTEPAVATSQPMAYSEDMLASSQYAPKDDSESWDDLICRRVGATGSRQVTRRCHTRWQWAQMEAAATETMRDIWSMPRGIRD